MKTYYHESRYETNSILGLRLWNFVIACFRIILLFPMKKTLKQKNKQKNLQKTTFSNRQWVSQQKTIQFRSAIWRPPNIQSSRAFVQVPKSNVFLHYQLLHHVHGSRFRLNSYYSEYLNHEVSAQLINAII